MRRLPALMLLAALASCTRPATQLVVVVDTDYAAPAELSTVMVRVLDADDEEVSVHEFAVVGGEPGPTQFSLPFSFGLVPVAGDASRRVTVVVTGLEPSDQPLVTRRARTGFLEGQSLRLPMYLARRCESASCSENETCTRDGCEPVDVPVESLVPVEPGQELVVLDAGRPDAGLSDAGLSDAGLSDAGLSDAGLLDGGLEDAAVADGGIELGCGTPERASCDSSPCSCRTCCELTCTDPAHCDPSCSGAGCAVGARDVDTLDALCTMSSTCVIDARAAGVVDALCTATSSCDVDCRGAGSCSVRCQLGAECLVRCADVVGACELATCTGGSGSTSCPGDVVVCNRPCP